MFIIQLTQQRSNLLFYLPLFRQGEIWKLDSAVWADYSNQFSGCISAAKFSKCETMDMTGSIRDISEILGMYFCVFRMLRTAGQSSCPANYRRGGKSCRKGILWFVIHNVNMQEIFFRCLPVIRRQNCRCIFFIRWKSFPDLRNKREYRRCWLQENFQWISVESKKQRIYSY